MSDFIDKHAGEIFGLIGLIISGFLLPMFKAWLDEHLTAKRAARVNTAIQSGLNVAIQSLTAGKNSRETLTAVMNDPTTRDSVIDLAKEYVIDTVPATLGKLGVEDRLNEIISARVETAVAALAEKYTTVNKAIVLSAETDNLGGRSGAV